MKTDDLIRRVAAESAAVRPLADPLRRAQWWLAAALVATTLGVLYFGVRSDMPQAWYSTLMPARVVLLAATLWLAVTTAFRLAVPGAEHRVWARWWPLVALGALVSLSAAEVLTGAVTGSMGSPLRAWMCVRKVAFVGTLPAILAVILIQRAAPLEPRWTAMLGVTAAGAAGALTSEIACPIHAPLHIFLWHIVPVVVFGLLGAGIGTFIWRRRRA